MLLYTSYVDTRINVQINPAHAPGATIWLNATRPCEVHTSTRVQVCVRVSTACLHQHKCT